MKVGVSEYTHEKQWVFKGIAKLLLKAAKGAITKAGRDWANDAIYIFDINAGPGIYQDPYGQQIKGSPLILLELAKELKLKYKAYFIERDEKTFLSLLRNLPQGNQNIFAEFGDHCEILPKLLHDGQNGRKRYGLLYTDPTGQIPPFNLLESVSRMTRYERLDLVVSVSATNLKRARGAGHLDETLEDYLSRVKKKYWLIREPVGKHQWSFLVGSNWVNLPDWKKAGFYRYMSPRGQEIMDCLNKTREERLEQVQLALPLVS